MLAMCDLSWENLILTLDSFVFFKLFSLWAMLIASIASSFLPLSQFSKELPDGTVSSGGEYKLTLTYMHNKYFKGWI